MKKRIVKIVFSITLILSLISLSRGFDDNANRVNPSDPNDKRQREYTRENATKPVSQGGYYGGRDTLTSEGMLLKKEVHKNYADGGTKFDFSDKEEKNV